MHLPPRFSTSASSLFFWHVRMCVHSQMRAKVCSFLLC
jgi:hypothetical protein